jgi:hypothetical protein
VIDLLEFTRQLTGLVVAEAHPLSANPVMQRCQVPSGRLPR